MATWQFIATELDGAPVTELPLHGVKITDRLDATLTLDAQLLLPDNDILAALAVDATDPLRRAIVAERDGVPMAAAVILRRQYKTSTRTFTLQTAGWWWLFRRRLINVETFYSTDQGAVANDLVANVAQANKSGGALGVAVVANVHGVHRDREYPHFELKPVSEAVEQLAAVEGGFDWSVDTAYNADVLEHTFRTHYPRRGRNAAASGFVFELGRNVIDFDIEEDGTGCVNAVTAVGAGEGDDMLTVTVADSSALAEGYPLLEQRISHKTVESPSVLDGHARAYLTAYGRPVSRWRATVLADADPPLGSYVAGDEARLRVQPGDNHRWPDGYDRYHRIIETSVEIPDQGTETVNLTFGETVA